MDSQDPTLILHSYACLVMNALSRQGRESSAWFPSCLLFRKMISSINGISVPGLFHKSTFLKKCFSTGFMFSLNSFWGRGGTEHYSWSTKWNYVQHFLKEPLKYSVVQYRNALIAPSLLIVEFSSGSWQANGSESYFQQTILTDPSQKLLFPSQHWSSTTGSPGPYPPQELKNLTEIRFSLNIAPLHE